jgi:hypothetical protein
MLISYDVLSTPNNCVQLEADQREAVASRKNLNRTDQRSLFDEISSFTDVDQSKSVM